jgi:hypothetical protein
MEYCALHMWWVCGVGRPARALTRLYTVVVCVAALCDVGYRHLKVRASNANAHALNSSYARVRAQQCSGAKTNMCDCRAPQPAARPAAQRVYVLRACPPRTHYLFPYRLEYYCAEI